MKSSLSTHLWPTRLSLLLAFALGVTAAPAGVTAPPRQGMRILPLGDSITRGTYLQHYTDGKPVGLPSRAGGGYRKPLQDKLRAAGIAFDFVGELNYDAYGQDGRVDPAFDPDHQGMAGFSNVKITMGGVVPAPEDVLASLDTKEVVAHGVVEVLEKFQPDVILLMSGSNGFDSAALNELIGAIVQHSHATLLVATIPPQRPPRAGWEKVADYNTALTWVIEARVKAGQRVGLVDINATLSAGDLLADGVHPNAHGLEVIASTWFRAIQARQ